MSKKTIFLDIDGVLNSYKWSLKHPSGLLHRSINDLDPRPMSLLAGFLNQFQDIDVVIVSDWRKLMELEDLRKLFSFFEINPLQIVDYTPAHENSNLRGEEVKMYLSKHSEIKDYVCVDNDNQYQDLSDKLVLVNPEIGLVGSDLILIAKKLGVSLNEKR